MQRRTKNAYRPNTYRYASNTLRKSNHKWQVTTAAAELVSCSAQKQHPVKWNRNNNNYGCNYNSCVYVALKPHATYNYCHIYTPNAISFARAHFGLRFNDISPHTCCVNNVSLLDFSVLLLLLLSSLRFFLFCQCFWVPLRARAQCTPNRNENLFCMNRRAVHKKLNKLRAQ